jgi:hypothetical protein
MRREKHTLGRTRTCDLRMTGIEAGRNTVVHTEFAKRFAEAFKPARRA